MSQPTIVFRVDASLHIGTGHVMRCLTLADALREGHARCVFISRAHSGNLLELIRQRGHEVRALPSPDDAALPTLPAAEASPAHAAWLGCTWEADAEQTLAACGPQPADWLVVDHYALDERWERRLRPACRQIMVIDDLADRPHHADMLLDQNLGRTARDYTGLIPSNTTTLIGPKYALLRPEFFQMRAASLSRRAQPQLKTLLITLGGVDVDNATSRVLQALSTVTSLREMSVIVVMGPHAPWLAQVEAQAATMPCPTRVLVGVNDMAQLMAQCDLAIGAAGSTSWERCCMGLPTIQLVLADNQNGAAAALAKKKAALTLPPLESLGPHIRAAIEKMSPAQLNILTKNSARICDGRGSGLIVKKLLDAPIAN